MVDLKTLPNMNISDVRHDMYETEHYICRRQIRPVYGKARPSSSDSS